MGNCHPQEKVRQQTAGGQSDLGRQQMGHKDQGEELYRTDQAQGTPGPRDKYLGSGQLMGQLLDLLLLLP